MALSLAVPLHRARRHGFVAFITGVYFAFHTMARTTADVLAPGLAEASIAVTVQRGRGCRLLQPGLHSHAGAVLRTSGAGAGGRPVRKDLVPCRSRRPPNWPALFLKSAESRFCWSDPLTSAVGRGRLCWAAPHAEATVFHLHWHCLSPKEMRNNSLGLPIYPRGQEALDGIRNDFERIVIGGSVKYDSGSWSPSSAASPAYAFPTGSIWRPPGDAATELITHLQGESIQEPAGDATGKLIHYYVFLREQAARQHPLTVPAPVSSARRQLAGKETPPTYMI